MTDPWQPSFTSDWFSTHAPAWANLFARLQWDARAPKTVIEIGSYEGRSSLWILQNLLLNKDSRLHCVDVFPDRDGPDSYWSRYENNVLKSPQGKQVSPHLGSSYSFFMNFLPTGQTVDFIYLDGSHRAADVLEDLVFAFRALRPGGVIICDDYLGGSGSEGDLLLGSPKLAIDAFTNIYRDRLSIVTGHPIYQLVLVKTSDRPDDDKSSRGG